MADNKNYYYLKLKDNFFDRPEIKAIEGMQSGYEYICIIQKMYLRSLCREGKLMLTDSIPYDIRMLSSVLGHKEETIKCAIDVFIKLGLCEIMDDKSIFMLEIQKFIGRSSTEAERIRKYREKIKQEKGLTCIENNTYNNNETNVQEMCTNVQEMYNNRTPKIELELELELELKKEKEKDLEKNNFSSFFPFNELLIYFNTTTKKPVLTFSPTVTHRIQQWVDTGYTIGDFKRIIDIKTAAWLNNPKMDSQLRPDVLFGDKFQYYVNEKTPEQIEQQKYEQEDTEYQKRQQKRLIEQHEKDEKEKAARNLARIERENKEKADEIRRKEVGEMAEDPEFLRKMLKDVLKSKRIDA